MYIKTVTVKMHFCCCPYVGQGGWGGYRTGCTMANTKRAAGGRKIPVSTIFKE